MASLTTVVPKAHKPLLLSTALALLMLAPQANAAPQVISRLSIELPATAWLDYQGKFAKQFPQGLPIGVGSGLSFIGKRADGARNRSPGGC